MEYEICIECFKNQWLKRYIEENGEIKICTRCGRYDKKVISLHDKKFQNLFKGVFRYYYSEILYNTHWGGYFTWVDLLSKKNEVLSFRFTCSMKNINNVLIDDNLYNILCDEFESHINNFDTDVSLYYGGGRMDAFVQPIKDERWDWLTRLNDMIVLNNPYKIVKIICNEVLDLIKPLETILLKDILYRARIGIDAKLIKPDILLENIHEVIIPYKNYKIDAPKPSVANDGRFNRKGTSYLYLASTIETAINEIKPCVGNMVSIGQFRISKEVKIIDFTKLDFYNFAFNDNKIDEYIKLSNLEEIMRMPNPDKQYTITQCFADAFILLGYEGIKFKSSVSDSTYNIVLFENANADYVEGSHQAIRINGMRYDYENANTKINEEYLNDYIDVNNGLYLEDILQNFGMEINEIMI